MYHDLTIIAAILASIITIERLAVYGIKAWKGQKAK